MCSSATLRLAQGDYIIGNATLWRGQVTTQDGSTASRNVIFILFCFAAIAFFFNKEVDWSRGCSMTMPIAVLAILFVAGTFLGLASRWLVVCLCEGVLLIAAFVLALALHKSVAGSLATLAAGFVVMQVAYIFSGILLEAFRHVADLLRQRLIDRPN